jgi:NADH-quinone oxidoreductase subunit N
MNATDFLCLAPLIILAAAPIIIMIGTTVRRNFSLTYFFTFAVFTASLVSLFVIRPYLPHNFIPLLTFDNFGLLFLGIIYSASILITSLSYEYLRIQFGEREEYFIILLVAALGASVLVLANHFITFFLGLEILSISLYVLTAYLKWRNSCVEAGVKFAIFSSLASAFMLFGMGLIYALTGTMSFNELALAGSGLTSPVFITGILMILVAIGFKLALVPFHMWTADVYQGAPMPVTAFIATVSKGSVLALALRLFSSGADSKVMITVISVIAVASMFTGNLLALNQNNTKRLLAYSSIAHLGYLSITLVAGRQGIGAAIFYLAAYTITTVGAFSVLSALSVCERDADSVKDIRGLFHRNPWLAIVMTLSLLSLAGIPLTAGFMSKFYLVLEGARAGFWVLAVSLVVNSAISLYYYLRLIREMFTETVPFAGIKVSSRMNLVLAIVFAGILLLGIMPSFLLRMISSML